MFVLTCADMRTELSQFGNEVPVEIDVLRSGTEVWSIAATIRKPPYLELQYSRQSFVQPLASNGSEYFFPQLGCASDGFDLLLAEREGFGRCGDAPMLSHCSSETCSTTCFGRARSLVRMSLECTTRLRSPPEFDPSTSASRRGAGVKCLYGGAAQGADSLETRRLVSAARLPRSLIRAVASQTERGVARPLHRGMKRRDIADSPLTQVRR